MTGGLTNCPSSRALASPGEWLLSGPGPVQRRLPGNPAPQVRGSGFGQLSKSPPTVAAAQREKSAVGCACRAVRDAPTCPELPQVARSRVSAPVCLRNGIPTSVRQPGSKNAPQEFVARSRVGKGSRDLRFGPVPVALPAAADISAVRVDHVSGGDLSRDRPRSSSEQPIPPLRRTPAGRGRSPGSPCERPRVSRTALCQLDGVEMTRILGGGEPFAFGTRVSIRSRRFPPLACVNTFWRWPERRPVRAAHIGFEGVKTIGTSDSPTTARWPRRPARSASRGSIGRVRLSA